jgi:tetratricopeptide (TPR) repeat protein
MDAMYRLGVAEWDKAVALGRRSFALGQQTGNVQEAELAQTITAHALYYSGRIATAWREYQSIVESSRRRANRQHIGWGLFLSGRSSLALGRIDEANELLEEGYEQLRELPDIVSQTMCEGSLARAALLQDRIDRAEEVAGSLLSRLRSGKRPAVGQCLDAYGNLATVTLEISARRLNAVSRRNASRAVNELRIFSCFFPVGRPAAYRCRAVQARLAGRTTIARRLATSAVEHSSALGMPYEELLAHEEVIRNIPPGEGVHARAAMEASRERLHGRLNAA